MHEDARQDNGKLDAKLALRRYFLSRYHAAGDARVFDACQGSGVIWNKLRQEFEVASYWGVDLKKKSGRLQVDSVELLTRGLTEDVIDVDVYGSPWGHWEALLRTTKAPRTVFLTIGEFGVRQRPLSRVEARLLGIEPFFGKMPERMKLRIARTNTLRLLSLAPLYGLDLVEVAEAERGMSARYIGVRLAPLPSLAPTTSAPPPLPPPSRPRRRDPGAS